MSEDKKKKRSMPTSQRKGLILSQLGHSTVEDFAKKCRVSVATIYRDLVSIRKERDLISKELIANVAEEQFNRLNYLVNISFQDLKNAKEAIEELKKRKAEMDKNGLEPDTPEVREYWKLMKWWLEEYAGRQIRYRFNEEALTRFLKNVGIYKTVYDDEDRGNAGGVTIIFQEGMGPIHPPKVEKEFGNRG